MFLVSVCVCVCVSVCVSSRAKLCLLAEVAVRAQVVCSYRRKFVPFARRRVFVCDRVPTQGGGVCLGAGQAVPNPASSRRWPFREGPES